MKKNSSGRSSWAYGTSASQGKRKEQQDAVNVWRDSTAKMLLLVVADGVGSTNGAAIASQLAVEIFVEDFAENSVASRENQRLVHALEAANNALAARISDEPSLDGMSTTLVAALLCENKLWWISVGDSPLFIVNKREVKRINADHSLASSLEKMARHGLIDEDQAKSDPSRNQLTSVLSGKRIKKIDCPHSAIWLSKNEQVLVASDGINSLTPEVLRSAIEIYGGLPQNAADKVIHEIEQLDLSGQDNVTVALAAPLEGAGGLQLSEVVAFARSASNRYIKAWPAVAVCLVILFANSFAANWWVEKRNGQENIGSPKTAEMQPKKPSKQAEPTSGSYSKGSISKNKVNESQDTETNRHKVDWDREAEIQQKRLSMDIQILLLKMKFAPESIDGSIGESTKIALKALNRVAGTNFTFENPAETYRELFRLELSGFSNVVCDQVEVAIDTKKNNCKTSETINKQENSNIRSSQFLCHSHTETDCWHDDELCENSFGLAFCEKHTQEKIKRQLQNLCEIGKLYLVETGCKPTRIDGEFLCQGFARCGQLQEVHSYEMKCENAPPAIQTICECRAAESCSLGTEN
ncbi:MAG: serine/threonine-protein phosphatase [Gammaproteobacteria bacterium]|nr:serine/threonine-protein phosphatase [Gammaproteobacteria bacterium]